MRVRQRWTGTKTEREYKIDRERERERDREKEREYKRERNSEPHCNEVIPSSSTTRRECRSHCLRIYDSNLYQTTGRKTISPIGISLCSRF